MVRCLRPRWVWRVLLALVILVLAVAPAAAHVKPWYEWCLDQATGKPKRQLKVWVDPSAGSEWQGWTDEAMANWNAADTGWTLQRTSSIEGADVTVHSAPIPPRSNGTQVAGRCQTDCDGATGEVVGATIVANSNFAWGTSGDGVSDPVKLLKHELGHAMRLDHSELGNLMDEILAVGDHDCTPNVDDREELADSASTTRPLPAIQPEGTHIRIALGAADLAVPTSDYWSVDLHFGIPPSVLPLEGVMLPEPAAVPATAERVLVAAAVLPLAAEFSLPARLQLTWSAATLTGTAMTGELHGDLLPVLDPQTLVPVRWVPSSPAGGGGGGRWRLGRG